MVCPPTILWLLKNSSPQPRKTKNKAKQIENYGVRICRYPLIYYVRCRRARVRKFRREKKQRSVCVDRESESSGWRYLVCRRESKWMWMDGQVFSGHVSDVRPRTKWSSDALHTIYYTIIEECPAGKRTCTPGTRFPHWNRHAILQVYREF